jgi:hypothetical protein
LCGLRQPLDLRSLLRRSRITVSGHDDG